MSTLLKSTEAAKRLAMSTRTLRRLVHAGKGPKCVRVNSRNWLFREQALEAWVERKER